MCAVCVFVYCVFVLCLGGHEGKSSNETPKQLKKANKTSKFGNIGSYGPLSHFLFTLLIPRIPPAPYVKLIKSVKIVITSRFHCSGTVRFPQVSTILCQDGKYGLQFFAVN